MLKVVQSRVCFNIFQIFTFHDLRKLYTLVTIFIYLFIFFCIVIHSLFGWLFFYGQPKKKKKNPKSCMSLAVGSFVCFSFLSLYQEPFLLDRHI